MAKKYKLIINKDACKGCRLCIDFCPNGVLKFSSDLNAKGVPSPEVTEKECIGCKNCTLVCPEACIEIYEIE